MNPSQPIYTIGRHLVEQEKDFPKATGEFTSLLWDLTIAFKIISNEVNNAGLGQALGLAGFENVHGEEVRELDVFAHEMIFRAMDHGGHLCLMASEESHDVIPIPKKFKKGKYILLFDPLDGSSNIDVSAGIGSIFSILRKVTDGEDGSLEDCLQPGVQQVAAGYVVYGSNTMLVYTTGQGVNGFTLDPAIGEFLLSHRNVRIPKRGNIYSVNEGSHRFWDEPTRRFVAWLKSDRNDLGKPYSLRYIGSMVSDVHRTLLKGGVFLHPANCENPDRPKAKLRLLYEANPMAFILEEAGGKAVTGSGRILQVSPVELHERVPVIMGSPFEVEMYERFGKEEFTPEPTRDPA
ncbi:MAG TPA: class 1 fructose-bisphosphatase [Acidobacteriota bacterium]|nr:class 1 fructose-bisphosphatase [Acidobacteriota bacterium]